MPSRIPAGWNLPASLRARLSQRPGRQRALLEDGHLLLVLHEPPSLGQRERVAALFWREPDGSWHASNGKIGVGALQNHVLAFEKAVDEWETAFERANGAEEIFRVLRAISPLGRAATNLSNALQSARDLVPEAAELIEVRDIAADVERAGDLLLAETRDALEFAIARQGETQSRLALDAARAGDRLNLIAAIFLPLSAVTGLFAMDIHSGIADTPQNFFIVSGAAIFLGLFLGLALGRRRPTP